MFVKLLGNKAAHAALSKMLQEGSMASTLLFTGPEGVGKKQCAFMLAELLMGESHAKRVRSFSHPDVHVYAPEGKLAMHTMASMKSLIEEVGMPPFEAPCKVFIIDEADRMLPSASNALLKTLEEPTLDSYIILISSHPDSLLPTIVSRARHVSFFPVSESEISAYLKETYSIEKAEADRLSILSQGSVSRAKLLVEAVERKIEQPLMNILTQLYRPNIVQLLTHLSEIEGVIESKRGDSAVDTLETSREVDFLLEKMLYWFRDIELIKAAVEDKYLFYPEHKEALTYCSRTLVLTCDQVHEEIMAIRKALLHNVKLKNCLEQFFLKVK